VLDRHTVVAEQEFLPNTEHTLRLAGFRTLDQLLKTGFIAKWDGYTLEAADDV
jgi:hypothetical protein